MQGWPLNLRTTLAVPVFGFVGLTTQKSLGEVPSAVVTHVCFLKENIEFTALTLVNLDYS